MSRSYNYAVVRVTAHPARDERLNVGIVVFDEASLDARMPKSLDKLAAMSGALDVQTVRSTIEALADIDASIVRVSPGAEERLKALASFSPLAFSGLGSFAAHSEQAYEDVVATLLRRFVDPEPAPLRARVKRGSPLLSVIKTAFRQERVLAKKGEDLSAHRVVPNLPLAEGLAADLVLRNGALHVIETVDASSDEIVLRRVVTDIAVSALILEQARILFGEDTKARLVYHASASIENVAMPSLKAAAHQGTELINWASRDDRNRFVHHIASLATPLELKGKKGSRYSMVHASTQHKLAIN